MTSLLQLNDYDIRKGKKIGVTISFNNHRLFVGNIPKNRDRDEILEEFAKYAPGLMEVIIYSSPDDKKKNRGFCFLEYESHKAASLAKRRLGTGRIKVWSCDIIVDWADPQDEPDEGTMSKVKVLYVRNLTQDVTEEKLKEQFEQFGKVERVKKIKDYAFVHFEDRDNAVLAMRDLDGKEVGGSCMEVSLAKPPSDKKKKDEVLRARERRMMQMMQGRSGLIGCDAFSMSPTSMMPPPIPPIAPGAMRAGAANTQSRLPLRGPMARDYDYDYDFIGFNDYRGGYNETFFDEYCRAFDGDYLCQRPGQRQNSVGGLGHGIQQRGRVAGLRGNNKLDLRQLAVVQVTPGQAVVEPHGIHRNVVQRGIRAKVPNITTAAIGKRKLDGMGNQGDPKRRFGIGNSWGSHPLPQQPLNGAEQWFTDSYPTWS
ncbi:hypothetical protein PVAND_000221 [Polypedilum vanderplanki]|uniref:RRM domain-containing protein n=1 Tax=Polypedilum vanderplanki TaxID=319348 RepID=A0A9J6BJC0_POLVA|nr:hypothetical protein PVAND_000221 [Polypedilum vanderplanki]